MSILNYLIMILVYALTDRYQSPDNSIISVWCLSGNDMRNNNNSALVVLDESCNNREVLTSKLCRFWIVMGRGCLFWREREERHAGPPSSLSTRIRPDLDRSSLFHIASTLRYNGSLWQRVKEHVILEIYFLSLKRQSITYSTISVFFILRLSHTSKC